MSYLAEQKRTLSFRRLPFAAKRRRARPLVAALRRLSRVVLGVVPLLALAGWLLYSDQFRVREIVIAEGGRADRGWISERLGTLQDQNLLLLDLHAIREVLEQDPWVRSLRLEKQLPNRLVVELEEHQPVAVLQAAEGAYLLSREGEPIIALAGGQLASYDLLTIDRSGLEAVGNASSGLEAAPLRRVIGAVEQLRSGPIPWARDVRTVRMLSPEDLEFEFGSAPFQVRARNGARADALVRRLGVVDDLLAQLRDRFGELERVDVRAPRRIVVTPGAAARPADAVPNRPLPTTNARLNADFVSPVFPSMSSRQVAHLS